MSRWFRMTRERWAAREMCVTRWLKNAGDKVAREEPICEVRIDGRLHRVCMSGTQEVWGIYGPLVEVGEEVPTGGELFEYSDSGGTLAYPLVHQLHPRWPVFRRRERYPRLFVSYRREDAEAFAGRLHEALGNRFGEHEVFMDLFSIQPGEAFPSTIQQAAAHCDVMLAIVGSKWLDATGSRGGRHLDDEQDYLRREIVAGLDRRILVIPLLVGGARVPERTQLPDDLHGFEQLQMLELSARHWNADVATLIPAIKNELDRTGAV